MAFIPAALPLRVSTRPDRVLTTMRANVAHPLSALTLATCLVLTPFAPSRAQTSPSEFIRVDEQPFTSLSPHKALLATSKPGEKPILVQRGTSLDSTSETSATLNGESARQHVPLAQRLSAYLQSHNLSPPLTVYLLSALPLVELRGGVPLGFFLSLPPPTTFILSILGNLTPIVPLLLLLRLSFVQTLAARLLARAREKARKIGSARSRTLALMLFVGIPLPGTGAWTGSVVAFVLGMSFAEAFVALGGGVVMAACVMMAVCGFGVWGWILGGGALASVGVAGMLREGQQEAAEETEG